MRRKIGLCSQLLAQQVNQLDIRMPHCQSYKNILLKSSGKARVTNENDHPIVVDAFDCVLERD